MGFATIVPPPKSTASFKIASLAVRGGSHKLQISMPTAIYTQFFGAAERLTIEIGSGPDEGKMLLRTDPNGLFKPTLLKRCAIIRFPELEWAPDFGIDLSAPEYSKAAGGGMLLNLPDWAWSKERQTAIRKAREQVARERAGR